MIQQGFPLTLSQLVLPQVGGNLDDKLEVGVADGVGQGCDLLAVPEDDLSSALACLRAEDDDDLVRDQGKIGVVLSDQFLDLRVNLVIGFPDINCHVNLLGICW